MNDRVTVYISNILFVLDTCDILATGVALLSYVLCSF